MSTRCKPIKAIGDVNVLAPSTNSPYYRLTWIEPDGRHGRTSGGRTLTGALSKAAQIDAGLQRATGPKGLTPLVQIMDEYLASPARRNQKTKKNWSPFPSSAGPTGSSSDPARLRGVSGPCSRSFDS